MQFKHDGAHPHNARLRELLDNDWIGQNGNRKLALKYIKQDKIKKLI